MQKQDVRFFALDSNYMDRDQQTWLDKELKDSNAKWKIAYFIRCRSASAAMKPNTFQPPPDVIF